MSEQLPTFAAFAESLKPYDVDQIKDLVKQSTGRDIQAKARDAVLHEAFDAYSQQLAGVDAPKPADKPLDAEAFGAPPPEPPPAEAAKPSGPLEYEARSRTGGNYVITCGGKSRALSPRWSAVGALSEAERAHFKRKARHVQVRIAG